MIGKDKCKERRRLQRYLTAGEAFAVIKNHEGKLGQVVDISLRGLAFKYIEDDKPAEGNVEIDIYISPKKLRIKDIEATIIGDHMIENDMAWSVIRMRRMSVAFTNLTETQQTMIQGILARKAKDKRLEEDGCRIPGMPSVNEPYTAFG